jgi:hypothetical protein
MMETPDYQTLGEVLFRSLPADVGPVVLLFETADGDLNVLSSEHDTDRIPRLIIEMFRRYQAGVRPSKQSHHRMSKEH